MTFKELAIDNMQSIWMERAGGALFYQLYSL